VRGEAVLQPLRTYGPPVVDQIGVMPYNVLQSMLDPVFPSDRQYYWKAHFMQRISDAAIDTMIQYFAAVPSPFTAIGFQQLGNAANRVDPHTTAFSHRDARYDCLMLSGWDDRADADTNINWTRDLYSALSPSFHPGIYVNAFGVDSEQRIQAAYSVQSYDRLVALKRKYDPANLFRLNPNIDPQG
jgi:hypothetical protein